MPPTTSARAQARARAAAARRQTTSRVHRADPFVAAVRHDLAQRCYDLSRASSTADQRARWRDDPEAWVRERTGGVLWSKQRDIMRSVRDNPRTAVRSCHGVGKSWSAALVVCWFVDTHEPDEIFVVSTAPTYAQVYAILWRYIRQVQRRHDLPGKVTQQAEWKIDGELIGYGRKPADTDNQGMQGLHATVAVLAVIDEACGVPAQIWTAIDSLCTTDDSRVLALGNPDTTSSRFHEVCTGQDPGWHVIGISALESPNFTDEGEQLPERVLQALVRRSWVEDKKVRWGENSPLYKIKVLGEFADDENTLIPASWVYEAQLRWQEWDEQGRPEPAGQRWFSCDVARFGEDATAVATRQGPTIYEVEQREQLDSVQVTDWLDQLLQWPRSESVVDSVGIGGPVVDQLRRGRGRSPVALDAGASTGARDITGKIGFLNVRSAMWWRMRELLDPYRGAGLMLPPDDELRAELCTPLWDLKTGGEITRIVVESRESIVARLGRSPDAATAVVQAFWVDHVEDDVPVQHTGTTGSGLVARDYVDPADPAIPSGAARRRARRQQHTTTAW